ncbi:MAG: bifunctional diaminohydroxyphosphoribosylaminopyrimidine deaminase/5-amino-6-(5-phosphoribosylamino)uracil reductase RibD [Bacillota bacterium]
MDEQYMKRALELARLGSGYTNPNPLVGAVIVKDSRIIGEGYHQVYGGPHAEINAFRNTVEDVRGATMYVTLEPCSHYGKTPPCAEAIVEKGIAKVIVAMTDPNPLIAGRGIRILKDHGIDVAVGVLEDEARKLNEIFVKYITTGTPFCIMKTAMTLDGKIAAHTGDSKWISNESSRRYVHELRHRVSAIMVGIGTILADDPLLTTRLEDKAGKDPVRIVVDSSGRIPVGARILHLHSEAKTILAATSEIEKDKQKALESLGVEVIITPKKNGQVDLSYLFKKLGEMKLDSILLEGGATLNFSALQEGIVDKILTFIAPKIIGGNDALTPVAGKGIAYMRDAIQLENIQTHRFGDDLMIEAYIKKGGC